MKLIVNKKMINDYLEGYLNALMNPVEDVFADGLKGFTDDQLSVEKIDYPFILFAPESYLNIINKLNQMAYNGEFPSDLDFVYVIHALYAKQNDIRDNMINNLVNKGILTNDEIINTTLVTDFRDFDYSKFEKQYPDTTENPDLEGVEYIYDTPLELSRYYSAENNSNNEDLYLVILPVTNINYAGLPTDANYGNFVAVQNFTKSDGTKVLQSSYIAINIGDITDEDADIQYDHVDKIDYIDSIKFRFRLPNTLQ